MARYWVGTSADWHTAGNWSATSSGGGGAGVPTISDDVYFDAAGQALCQANSPIACNNLTMDANCSHIFLMIFQGGVIASDFTQHEGYFGPTGGGGYTLDFQGNWLFDGGSFSVGTGTGVDPICEFSGATKTYVNNHTGAASFQNVLISGEITIVGTRLSQMLIYQELSITGIMEINKYDITTTCRVDLNGPNATFGTFTGTIAGNGRFFYVYKDGDSVPSAGTIEISYFRFNLETGSVSEDIDQDLYVDGWNNVNQDWTHQGNEPWIHDDDADGNYISIPAVSGGPYDEYYTIENIEGTDWKSYSLTKLKVHLKGRLYDGVGGHASLIAINGYLWDGSTWQSAGAAFFNSTSYTEDDCSTSLHSVFTSAGQLDNMRLKLEVAFIVDAGVDKGGLNITQAWVEVEGTYDRNPIFTLNPRIWLSPSDVEIEYTDDKQTFQFLGTDRHYFMNKLTIHCDESDVDEAWLDFNTETSEIYVHSTFSIDNNAFPSAIFNILFGDGIHIFRGSVNFYFAYTAGAATELVVNPGNGTLILWPRGLKKLF